MTTTLIAWIATLTAASLDSNPDIDISLLPFMVFDLAMLHLVAVHYGVL